MNELLGMARALTPLEWAKQQACWERLATLEIDWPATLESGLISSSARSRLEAEAVKAQKIDRLESRE